jgi:hypothetical protein
MFGVPRPTAYGHLDKTETVPREPNRSPGPNCQGRAEIGPWYGWSHQERSH